MSVPSPLEPAAEPYRPTVGRLFMGDDGLRAGWSLLLFVILFGVITLSANFVLAHVHLAPKPPARSTPGTPYEMAPRNAAIGEATGFFALALAAFVMSLIERRPFARYGLPLRRMVPDFAIGLFWGMLSLSVLVGLLMATHSIAFGGVALHGAVALTYAAKWAVVFLFVGLLEEFLFRGYVQYTVARGVAGITRTMDAGNPRSHLIGFIAAAFIFSILLFTLAHTGNGGETALGIFSVALAGGTFAFSLYRTGSLWWAIGFHTSWDWAQSYLYSTPDSGNLARGHLLNSHPMGSALLSGGPTGPEGSVLLIPVMILVCLVIHFTLPRRQYALTPDQSPLPEAAEFHVAAPGHLHSSLSNEPF
jgi:membrane protease YdiL (CAAX protease family)